ncbi:hypothetical protein EXN66_Car003955 [Channa argus]|uniref:Uncharacterized protein n=1 Tax=Channa argus TaxID=215402 RepID=A0A6G1PDK2_CHAAH|nr:hypothetical protein EXN66_Car003955 [Channa argus]
MNQRVLSDLTDSLTSRNLMISTSRANKPDEDRIRLNLTRGTGRMLMQRDQSSPEVLFSLSYSWTPLQ